MQKPIMIVRASQAWDQMPGADLDAKLASGDWLVAKQKPKKISARRRVIRAQRRAEGWSNLNIWLSAEDLAAIKCAQLPGETVLGLLKRLIRRQSLL